MKYRVRYRATTSMGAQGLRCFSFNRALSDDNLVPATTTVNWVSYYLTICSLQVQRERQCSSVFISEITSGIIDYLSLRGICWSYLLIFSIESLWLTNETMVKYSSVNLTAAGILYCLHGLRHKM